MQRRDILLERINLRDKSFLHSFQRPLDKIMRAIRHAGIINPVVLRRKGKALQVVHGFSRVAACRRLGLTNVPAFVYSEKELPDREAFDMAFFDNVTTRSFNLAEQAMAMKTLSGKINLPQDEILGKYFPAMGLNPSRRILEDLLKLSKLNSQWLKIIVDQDIVLKNAAMLLELNDDDRSSLLPLIQELRPGTNKFREILRLLTEIAAREEISIKDLISGQGFKGMRANSKTSVPQRLDAFLKLLRERRYPLLHELNRKFLKAKNKLNLPESAQLKPYPNFEEPECIISLSFKTPEQMREIAEKLKQAAEDEALKEILEI
jgi:ParB/RepB/Spo0J family partition protein